MDFRASSLAIIVDRNDNFLFQAPAHARTTCWPIHCMCIYLDSIWLGLCYMDRACIRWLLSSVVSVLVFAARCYIHKHSLCRDVVSVRPSVCLSHSWTRGVIVSSNFFHLRVATSFEFFRTKRHNGALNAGGVGKTRDSRPVSGFIACECQVLSTRCRLTIFFFSYAFHEP